MRLKYFFVAMILPFMLKSQEITVPAGVAQNDKILLKNRQLDTLELPFFDDFSDPEKYNSNFSDTKVSIVQNACILPPSIGAAMFDAIDSAGNYYATSYSQSLIADYLTSQPLNLDYQGNNSIFLSFWYEPKGNLDAPETQDSLVLQFYAPSEKRWVKVWAADNYTNPEFTYVILQISDTSYLQKGFRFRFYNRISMASGSHPDLVGNCDQWFVDYIYLNKNRDSDDTISRDIAFQYPIRLKFDDYQSVPYDHYKNNYTQINHSLFINFRNNDNAIRQIDSMYIVFDDKVNNLSDDTLYLGSYTFGGQSNLHIDKNDINFSFPSGNFDFLDYSMKTKLVTDTYDSTTNNIVFQNKKIGVAYSYDDGTAENSYGLIGDALYALVAQKFYTYKGDELMGIEVYFNKVFKEAQPYYFYAMVWDNDQTTGLPGDLLYEQEGFEIDHTKLNDFQVFTFDEPVAVEDTFYIGWKKTVDEMMNVGLDINSTTENYKYYNLYNGEWQKSSIEGVLMMHPIFGNVSYAKIMDKTDIKISVYPNPANDYLCVELSENKILDGQIRIFDFSGKILKTQEINSNRNIIDISMLPQGIYFIELSNSQFTKTMKFIKQIE